jgi:chromosome segregation ATPase
LIAVQWVRETALRQNVQALTDDLQDHKESITNMLSRIGRNETEIQRLDGLKTTLTSQVKTNEALISTLKVDLDKMTAEKERCERLSEEYRKVVEKANESIKVQNDAIKKQNEEMQKLMEDRNQVVTKFNALAKEYQDLVDKWNKQQEDLAKAATNAPAPPRK